MWGSLLHDCCPVVLTGPHAAPRSLRRVGPEGQHLVERVKSSGSVLRAPLLGSGRGGIWSQDWFHVSQPPLSKGRKEDSTGLEGDLGESLG